MCDVNCYEEIGAYRKSAKDVAIGDAASPSDSVKVDSEEQCHQLCEENSECEAVVYNQGDCWGKADIYLPACAKGEGGMQTHVVSSNPISNCGILGDPHILSFDNTHGHVEDNTQLHHGHYHLVDADGLSIQGRFGYTKRFDSASSLVGIAAGGSYISDNHLVVVYKGDADGVEGFFVTWNTEEILQGGIGTKFTSADGVLTAECGMMNPEKYHAQARHTYGGTAADGDKPSYLFHIKNTDGEDIEIYLLIGDDAMNAIITMKKLDVSMDGWCGNFNCDADDDILAKLEERGAAANCDNDGDNLFKNAPAAPEYQTNPKHEVPTLENCAPDVLEAAKGSCGALAEHMQKGCWLDRCAEALTEAGDTAEMEAHFQTNNGFALSKLIAIPPWVQGTLGVILGLLFVGGMAIGLPSRMRRRRLYELAALDETPERDSSRTVRFGDVSGNGAMSAPFLSGLSRLRDTAAAALPFTSSESARPSTGWDEDEDDEEALLPAIAFEHDLICGEHEPI